MAAVGKDLSLVERVFLPRYGTGIVSVWGGGDLESRKIYQWLLAFLQVVIDE